MRHRAARVAGRQARVPLDHFGRRRWRVGDRASGAERNRPPAPCSAPSRSKDCRSLAAVSSLWREPSRTPRSAGRLAMSVEKVTRSGGEVVWRVRWRQHGRNRARTFSTRRDARDFDAEVRRQRRAGSLATLDAGAETFGEGRDRHLGCFSCRHTRRKDTAALRELVRLSPACASRVDRSAGDHAGSGRALAGRPFGVWGRAHCGSPCDGSARLDSGARIRGWTCLGESCPAREEGEGAPSGGGATSFTWQDRGDACSARRPRRDAHLRPRVCGASSW